MVKGDLDQHTTEKGNIKVDNFMSVSLFTPAHIQYAKYGRGPGKPPPINALLDWVKKKGIIIGSNDARGTAFVIARSIGKKGTKNYVKNAPNALEESFEKYIQLYAESLNKDQAEKLEKTLMVEYKHNMSEIKVSI